jgi:hypothetical protein
MPQTPFGTQRADCVSEVPSSCFAALRSVQEATRQVLDLHRPRNRGVEGRKAKLDAVVARLTRRQRRYNQALGVATRAQASSPGPEGAVRSLLVVLEQMAGRLQHLMSISTLTPKPKVFEKWAQPLLLHAKASERLLKLVSLCRMAAILSGRNVERLRVLSIELRTGTEGSEQTQSLLELDELAPTSRLIRQVRWAYAGATESYDGERPYSIDAANSTELSQLS